MDADPEARENLAMAHSKRFILREERNFVEVLGLPAKDESRFDQLVRESRPV
ncbi:MAG: hypothetical protein JWM63_5189 [Gammaproteobacteria bacterium]|nr:hypothetical protein [Gammaproteobacteria bacterium]